MADNGLRQLGIPRIGIYANLQKPEPLHLEINNWEHVIYVLYLEAVRKGKIDFFKIYWHPQLIMVAAI